MRQTYSILPVYAGDVSGVCSALFELGGMVVIHDPSGCNSTYNTHDETRWYDHDSLIFISGLTDVDAIMGNDQKLIDDVVDAVEQTHPRFVALVNSPIPYQLGTDFEAIARIVEERTGVPAFHVPTNGMHDYVRGAGLAFEAVAQRVAVDATDLRGSVVTEGGEASSISHAAAPATPTPSLVGTPTGLPSPGGKSALVNVLGMTPLDFAAPGTRDSLAAWLGEQGFGLLSCWAMGSSLGEIARAGEADLNLVVSVTGMRAARVLQRRFGTPYVVGLPVGGFAELLGGAMRQALAEGRSCVAYLEESDDSSGMIATLEGSRGAIQQRENSPGEIPSTGAEPSGDRSTALQPVALVGEPVVMGSIAAALRLSGHPTRVVCPVEDSDGLLGAADVAVHGEEEIQRALARDQGIAEKPDALGFAGQTAASTATSDATGRTAASDATGQTAVSTAAGHTAPVVVGDPFYQAVCPGGTRFCRLPHLGLSGRQWLHEIPDLVRLDAEALVGDGSQDGASQAGADGSSEARSAAAQAFAVAQGFAAAQASAVVQTPSELCATAKGEE